MLRKLFWILTLAALTACSAPASPRTPGLRVLATTTFLADITRNVTGDRAAVESLLPTGVDPHSYQTTPADLAKINASNVLVQNGLDYESFLAIALQNAGGKRLVITASDGLTPNRVTEGGQQVADPHMWLDPARAIAYVENIRDGLTKADPDGAAVYKANAETYIAQLKSLDAWIAGQVQTVPAARRLLVTNHEALGYFAGRYGFSILGTVVPGASTEASTSAQGLAKLIDLIKSSGAPAIFLGDVENPNLADQIASETGVKVVSDLHLESLTDGAPAATYLDMMRFDVTQIVEALK